MISTIPISRKRIFAFTLVELAIVVLIIGVIAAVGGPAYQTYIKNAKIAESYVLVDAIQKKQMMYYLENKKFSGSFHYGTNGDNTYLTPGGGAMPAYFFNEDLDASGDEVVGGSSHIQRSLPADGTSTYFQYKILTGLMNASGQLVDSAGNPIGIPLMFRYSPANESKTCFASASPSTYGLVPKSADSHYSNVQAGANLFGNNCTIIFQTVQAFQDKFTKTPMVTFDIPLGEDPRIHH